MRPNRKYDHSPPKPYDASTRQKEAMNSKGDKGARAELIAMAWLMSSGSWVFRNQSPCGSADIIEMDRTTMELRLYDVKSAQLWQKKDGSWGHSAGILTQLQIEYGIKRIIVMPDGHCYIDVGQKSFYEPDPSIAITRGKNK